MAYDVELADRIRDVLEGEPGVTEKKMFGGLSFLVDGHLAAGSSSQGGMLLRVDPVETDSLLGEAHVRPFEMRGRAMKGWLFVGVEALASEDALRGWVARGVTYARSLPPK